MPKSSMESSRHKLKSGTDLQVYFTSRTILKHHSSDAKITKLLQQIAYECLKRILPIVYGHGFVSDWTYKIHL